VRKSTCELNSTISLNVKYFAGVLSVDQCLTPFCLWKVCGNNKILQLWKRIRY